MRILLVSATIFEIAPTLNWLEEHFQVTDGGTFENNGLGVFPLVTGVGLAATAFHVGQFLAINQPGLSINAGIAGAMDKDLRLGDVLNVVSERFGDLGVEEADGRFTDLFELGLMEKDAPPFSKNRLWNRASEQADFLPAAHGLSVNKVHGFPPSIEAIRAKYPDAQLESMEGAAFFFACLLAKVPFLEIRSISNFVEARNRERWDLPLAINNLNRTLIALLEQMIPPR
ncbi:MAG: futalosine hydrolase [Saprospiraceae bacterium]|nr:futalosine hydrolase [Saprospiraceae bacterium]